MCHYVRILSIEIVRMVLKTYLAGMEAIMINNIFPVTTFGSGQDV